MAKPAKSKDLKDEPAPASPEGQSVESKPEVKMNIIVIALLIIVSTAVSSAASMYFLAPIVLKPLLATLAPAAGGEEAGAEGEASGEEGEGKAEEKKNLVGPVIDLEEFTVNLKDAGTPRYLRAKMSLNVTTEDPNFTKATGEAAKKWEEEFHGEMAHFVPAMRDIFIENLTKRSSTDLATEMGKQQFKDEVKKSIDGLFHGEHKVISVNLENFIIQ
jgi:flagellar basal body-associated protein FliL